MASIQKLPVRKDHHGKITFGMTSLSGLTPPVLAPNLHDLGFIDYYQYPFVGFGFLSAKQPAASSLATPFNPM